MNRPRHFLDLWSIEAADLRRILDDAKARKAARCGWPKGKVDADAPARDRTLAMVFQKHSTRTWFSFDAAIRQLGGASIISTGADMQLGRGETIEDTAKVLSRMVDAIMIRANRHEDIEALAEASERAGDQRALGRRPPVPDPRRPDDLRGASRAARRARRWPGWATATTSAPASSRPRRSSATSSTSPARRPTRPTASTSPGPPSSRAASRWATIRRLRSPAPTSSSPTPGSRWATPTREARLAALEPFQVDAPLMGHAAPNAIFMHCLPAHRGEEVTEDVIDGPRSVVFDEAENRIHAQKSILAWCFEAI